MNDTLMSLFGLAVGLVHVVFLVRAGRHLLQRRWSTMDAVVIAHSFLVLFPIIFDSLWGLPYYARYALYNAARRDPTTYFIYLTYMTVCGGLFFWQSRNTRLHDTALGRRRQDFRVTTLFVVGLMAPIVYLPWCPDLAALFDYGYLQQTMALQSPELRLYYANSYRLTYVSLLCAMALGLTKEIPRFFYWVAIAVALFSVYINGKRNIVFLALAVLLLTLKIGGYVNQKALLLASAVSLTGYLGYHLWYAATIRSFLATDQARLEAMRIDFGHDLDICSAIFLEIHKDQDPMLEYRGQTIVFNVLQWIPREYWDTKPYPYYRYLTARAAGAVQGTLGYGLTSSWMGETIANFGWLGMLLAPLTIGSICRIGDRCPGLFARLMSIVVACLFLFIDPSSFIVLLIIWAGLVRHGRT